MVEASFKSLICIAPCEPRSHISVQRRLYALLAHRKTKRNAHVCIGELSVLSTTREPKPSWNNSATKPLKNKSKRRATKDLVAIPKAKWPLPITPTYLIPYDPNKLYPQYRKHPTANASAK